MPQAKRLSQGSTDKKLNLPKVSSTTVKRIFEQSQISPSYGTPKYKSHNLVK